MSDFGITFSDQQSFNDDVRNRLDRMREQRLRQAVNFGTRYNPVRTGQAAQHGLPFTVSDDILDAALQQTKQQNIYREVNSYPVSMDFFADPAFASLAADDADNVGAMEGLFKTLLSSGAQVVSGAFRFIDWERAKTEEWQTQMWMSLREQAIANMTPDERRRFIQAQQQLPSEFRPIEEPMTQKVMRGWEEMAQGLQADARTFWGQTIVGESAFSAIQSITQMLALAPLGPAAVMAGFGSTEFGSAMQAGEAAGLSPQEAFKTAVAGAFAEIALGFTPVKSLLAGTAGNTLRQTLVNTAKAELATEIPTTLIQSFTQFMEFERPNTSADFVEYAQRLPREVAVTALSTLFSTGVTAPIIYRSQEAVNKQASDIDVAQRNSDVLGQIQETMSRSKAAANGPALFQKLVAAQAKAYEVREIRVDRQIVEDSLEELGGIEAVRKALPEVASKLEAQDPADGAELFIRPEQWAEAVRLNPKFDEVLRQHVRINDQEMTAAEALIAEENKEKFLEELNRLIEGEAEILAEVESDRQSIEDDIVERVSGVRPQPAVAETKAELPEVAEQPQEVPEGAEVAQAIQEAMAAREPAEVAVEPATEQQPFDAWFANSQAVDVKGKPLELAVRPLPDGEGSFYSEAPAGTGNTLVSIANPLILTGDKANRFIKDAKFRQRTMQKARDLQKDGVIAHGKTQVDDRTVRDSIYAPLDEEQIRTNGRPDPSALEAPRVTDIKNALSNAASAIKGFVSNLTERGKTPSIDKEHAKAARQGDVEAGAKLTEAAAFAAAPYVFPANHGLREGILREATFDMSMLGVNTRAASAAKGVFASKGRSTASFYAVPPATKSRTPITASDVNTKLANVYDKLIKPVKTTTRVGYGASSQIVEGISGYTTIFSGYSFGQKPMPLPQLLSEYVEYKSRKRDSFDAWLEYQTPETVVRHLEEERALLVDNATRTRNFAVLRDAAKGLQEIINQINVDYDLKPSDVVATGEGGILNLYVLMNNPMIHDQKGKRGRAINFSRLIDIAKARGHDGLVIQNTFDGSTVDDVYVAFDSGQLKSADPFTYDKSGKLIPLSQRFDVTRPSILYAPEQQPIGPVTNDQLKQQAVIASSMFSNLAVELGIKPKQFWERYGPQFRVDEQARGAAPGAYLPKSMTVVLQSDQTADTLLHELTHHYVHILSVIAAQDTALEDAQTAAGIIRAREMFEDLVSEFDTDGFIAAEGYNTGQAWTRLTAEQQARIHERIAYQFGAYIAEDVAPTEKVRGAFRKMSDWLRKIYGKTLQKLDEAYFRRFNEHLPALTDDARRIFDRMIGSALAVEQAKAAEGSVPIFQSQEESGLTDEQWARLQADQEASDQEAIEQMMARFMRDEKWGISSRNRFIRKMQQQVRKKRAEARDRVQAEVERRPVYQAIRFFRTGERLTDQDVFAKIEGKHRLDVAAIKKLFTKAEDRKKLRGGRYGMTMKEGIDPDLAASMFGYESAGAMIQDIIDAKPIKQVVDEEAEALLRKENADLFDQNKIREAAIESIQNERTSRFIATELRFMSSVLTPVRILIAAARAAATQRIDGMTIRELRPDRYANQSKRASKDALKARRAGNNAEALNAKRRQLGLDQMAFVGRATKKRIEQHRKYLRRLAKPAKRKRVGADHGDVIDIVLSRIADGNNPLVVVQPGQVFQKGLSWHSQLMADQGSPSLLDAETSRQPVGWTGEEPATLADEIMSMPLGVDINDMTVEQLEDIVKAVKELEHVGKQLTEGNAASRKQKLADIDEQLADAVMQSIGRKHSRKTEDSWMQDPKRIYEKMSVQHYTMAGKSYVMDGGKYGVWFDYVVNVASQIEDAELKMRADLTRQMSEILKPVTVRGYRTKRRIDRLDGDYSLMELFVMACNLGNAQNAQRLLNNGYGKWTIDDVRMAIEENLNEQQILAVQKTWDVFSSIKPLIAKLEREDRGVEPTWVQPKPVAFTVAGKTVHLSGGYFPISYDGQASRLGAYTEQSKEAETRDVKSAVVATTHRAFLKNRAREVQDAPLLLSLSGAFASLEEIVHDIHWRQFGKDLNRLLGKNSKTSRAIQEKYGTDWLNDILNWRNRVVSGDMSGTRTALDNVMSWTGRFTSQASLLYNIGSLAIQWTGIFSIGAATGYSNAMYGASRLFNWRDAKTQMMRLSPQMELRYATRLREFSDLMSQIRGKITLKQKMEIHGYWLLQQAQSVADIAAWHAGFNKALSEGKSERSAADIAYQVVLDTQSSGRLQDLSTVEAGTVGRIFSVFYRPMNAQLNVWMRNAGYKSRARMIADFSAIFMIMPYVQFLLKDAIKPDEGEDEEFWTVKNQAALLGAETMKAFLGSFVYVREFSNSIGALFGQEVFSYSGPTRLRLIKDFERLVTQIAQGELDKSLFKAVSTISGAAGFPSATANRIIDGVHAVMNDKDVPPWAIITGTDR